MLVCPKCGNRYPGTFDRCPVDESTLGDDPAVTVVERAPPPRPDLGPDYRVAESIDSGGMGQIWRALHLPTGQPRAVKMLRGAATPSALKRFLREAQTLVSLQSPNIVRVFEIGDAAGKPFLAMELLEGETLSARLRGGTLGVGQSLSVGIDACTALDAAHAAGIVHRDLKPSNIFLARAPGAGTGTGGSLPPDADDWERAVLIDFGVAKPAQSVEAELTMTGQLIGTLSYMAPEQARGHAVGPATDIFGLGATLYRALCGRAPFRADSDLEMVAKVAAAAFDPPRRLRPDLPTGVEAVLVRAMAAEPSLRFADAVAMRDALRQALEVESDGETSAGGSEPTSTSIRERRIVTVLVTDQRPGIAALPGVAAELGAETVSLRGLGAMAIFGVRESEGDEPSRALRAALRLRSLGARSGVGTGYARPGMGGEVAGEAVGAAIDALNSAEPTQVWADAETYRRARGAFEFGRGERGTLEVVREREAGEPRGKRTTRAPLVGREPELLRLVGAFERVTSERRAGLVLVSGPPGIGKSRLARELAARLAAIAPEADHLVLRGDPTRRATAFGAFATAIASRAGVHEGQPYSEAGQRLLELAGSLFDADAAEATAPFLGELCGVPFPGRAEALGAAAGDAAAMRDRLRLAVGDVVCAMAGRATLVVEIEDAQWLDGLSWDLCEILLGRAETLPLFVVAVTRPELLDLRGEPQVGELVHVALSPMSQGEAQRLATHLAPALDEEARAGALARAGGNPLFLEEILLAIEAGEPVRALPPTVEAAIQSRLDHLAIDDKELCKRAAVLGTSFWEGAVRSLGVEPSPERMRRLRGQDLVARRASPRLAGEIEWSFRSAIVAEVAYALVPEEERRTLHRLAGRWLAQRNESDPEEIARHLSLGGDDVAAAGYLLEAVRRAGAVGDVETVLRVAPSALERLDSPHDRGSVHALRADVLYYAGKYVESAADGELASTLLPPGPERTHALHLLALCRRTVGDLERAAEIALCASREAEAQADGAATARALAILASVQSQVGKLSDALETARRARDIAEAAGSMVARAHSIMANAYVVSKAGDLVSALSFYELAASAHERSGDVRLAVTARMNRAFTLLELGRLEESRDELVKARIAAERVGNAHTAAWCGHNLGYVLFLMGEAEEGLRIEREALSWAQKHREARLLAACRLYVLAILVGAKRTEEAAAEVEECLGAAAESADEGTQLDVRGVVAELLVAQGRHTEALEAARALGAAYEARGAPSEMAAGAFVAWHRAATALGHVAEARAAIQRAVAHIESLVSRASDPSVSAQIWSLPKHREIAAIAADLGDTHERVAPVPNTP
ncbi:MAG: AAA family ATPase [Deltaproteobacteria bacterium]|nr:AAA family ATPase [Deltaproteobacteria bacterium]